MPKGKNIVDRICCWSASLVAIFTLAFLISLIFTFDFSEWRGIENFNSSFRPIQMLTVIPSFLLAVAYVIFVSGLHICVPENRKIWSQLAISFGLLYSGISIANYMIQLVTVIPSIQNGEFEGLTLLVSGYPNSIFFALMASYFLMCISLLFVAFVFSKEEKSQKRIRRLFQCAAMAIPLYLIGAIFNIVLLMMCGAMCWIVGTTIGMFFSASFFYKCKNRNNLPE